MQYTTVSLPKPGFKIEPLALLQPNPEMFLNLNVHIPQSANWVWMHTRVGGEINSTFSLFLYNWKMKDKPPDQQPFSKWKIWLDGCLLKHLSTICLPPNKTDHRTTDQWAVLCHHDKGERDGESTVWIDGPYKVNNRYSKSRIRRKAKLKTWTADWINIIDHVTATEEAVICLQYRNFTSDYENGLRNASYLLFW